MKIGGHPLGHGPTQYHPIFSKHAYMWVLYSEEGVHEWCEILVLWP
jgi:hypothetical protein